MNLISVILFYFCIAVTRCALVNYLDYLTQLQQKPRYKKVVPLVSGESRRDVHPLAAPKWSVHQQRKNGGHQRQKVPKPNTRSKKIFLNPNFRSKNLERPSNGNEMNVGIKLNMYDEAMKNIKRTNKKKNHRLRLAHLEAEPNTDPRVPKVGGLHPGHALLKPAGRMLRSSAKYPKDHVNRMVYGNPQNFGITYNKTQDRVLYSSFRRTGDDVDVENILLEAILRLKYYQERAGQKSNGVIVIGIEPERNNVNEDTSNEASEVIMDLRKNTRYQNHVKLDRVNKYKAATEEGGKSISSESESADFDNNPGNPYTLHKNRYHQNWQWNHFMSGDHMNLNPYGPKYNEYGPSGMDLFFGRKWWYFNQDDYVPLG